MSLWKKPIFSHLIFISGSDDFYLLIIILIGQHKKWYLYDLY